MLLSLGLVRFSNIFPAVSNILKGHCADSKPRSSVLCLINTILAAFQSERKVRALQMLTKKSCLCLGTWAVWSGYPSSPGIFLSFMDKITSLGFFTMESGLVLYDPLCRYGRLGYSDRREVTALFPSY